MHVYVCVCGGGWNQLDARATFETIQGPLQRKVGTAGRVLFKDVHAVTAGECVPLRKMYIVVHSAFAESVRGVVEQRLGAYVYSSVHTC